MEIPEKKKYEIPPRAGKKKKKKYLEIPEILRPPKVFQMTKSETNVVWTISTRAQDRAPQRIPLCQKMKDPTLFRKVLNFVSQCRKVGR